MLGISSRPLSSTSLSRPIVLMISALLNCTGGYAMDETTAPKQPTVPTDKWHELVLSIEINGMKIDEDLLLLQGVDGRLYARAVDVKQLRLLPPTTQPIVHDGVDYFDLGAYPGLTYKLNQAKQSVLMTADGKPVSYTHLTLPTILRV